MPVAAGQLAVVPDLHRQAITRREAGPDHEPPRGRAHHPAAGGREVDAPVHAPDMVEGVHARAEGRGEARVLDRPAQHRRARHGEDGLPERSGRLRAPGEVGQVLAQRHRQLRRRVPEAAAVEVELRLDRHARPHELRERRLRHGPLQVELELPGESLPGGDGVGGKAARVRQHRPPQARVGGKAE